MNFRALGGDKQKPTEKKKNHVERDACLCPDLWSMANEVVATFVGTFEDPASHQGVFFGCFLGDGQKMLAP